jgi:protoporphyrin/coproporphyrin ferrochelatase
MSESTPATATHHLLIMAYGGPDKLEDVRPYLLDVRHHRPTSEEIFREIEERYEQIGGRSPILELTQAQADGIENALNEQAPDGERWKVWLGMRHWHPYIAQTMGEMKDAGVERAVTLVMAPHYSAMSIGAYNKAVEAAETGIEVVAIDRWNLLPGYLDALEERINDALQKFAGDVRNEVPIIFTAHSLPERIREMNDPYEKDLQETFEAMKARFPGHPANWAYQSAAMTKDPWLGPDASEVIDEIHAAGGEHVLICPVGFVCEHVEILFDIDVEFMEQANELGMQLERITMVNDHPEMMTALAGLVRDHAEAAGWVPA